MIVNLSVATSETWKDASGEKKERTEWHRVVLFNQHHAKFASDYAKKGDLVHIEGTLQTRKWQDQSGQDKYTTEIVVQKFGPYDFKILSSAARENGETPQQSRQQEQRRPTPSGRSSSDGWEPPVDPDLHDEIPF